MHHPHSFLDIVKRATDWTLPTRCTVSNHPSRHTTTPDEGFELVDEEPFLPFAQPSTGLRYSCSPRSRGRKLKMGGKSNKFDYSNRSSTGFKLGTIIGHALEKEAAKLQKTADRDDERARKVSCGSGTNTSDDAGYTHIVDLQAPEKELGDDGLCALADGLETALQSGTRLAIEDLNLSGNGLSAISLARLAPIIKLARHDLKTCNLASNKLKIETDDEATQWEVFLRAFNGCFRLRRLDLRNNLGLGARALEILARVHTRERNIDPIPVNGCDSVLSLPSEHGGEAIGTDRIEHDHTYFPGNSLSHGQFLNGRRGLRSIPYIELDNIGLTDAGALWLSYVVQDHYYPTQLIDGLNATTAASAISAYQQDSGIAGLSWDEPPATLGKDARVLLRKSEAFRYRTMLKEKVGYADSLLDADELNEAGAQAGYSRHFLERKTSPTNRRTSIRSIHTTDGGEHEVSELESIRRKIQRHVIDEDGVRCVELWHASLTLLTCSRYLSWLAPHSRSLHFVEEASIDPAPLFPSIPEYSKSAALTPPMKSNRPSKLTVDTVYAPKSLHVRDGSYAAKLVATTSNSLGEPELAMTEVTNTPTTPKMVFKPHRKGAFSEITDLDLPIASEKLNSLIMRDHSPERFLRYQKKRIAAASREKRIFRDTSMAHHLPPDVIVHLVALLLPPEQLDVASAEQKATAWEWGRKRESLAIEMEWRKHDRSSQVWMLLERVGCLAYDG